LVLRLAFAVIRLVNLHTPGALIQGPFDCRQADVSRTCRNVYSQNLADIRFMQAFPEVLMAGFIRRLLWPNC